MCPRCAQEGEGSSQNGKESIVLLPALLRGTERQGLACPLSILKARIV